MSISISFFLSSDVPCSKVSLEPRSATRCSCEQVKHLNSFDEPKTLNLVCDNIKLRTWSNSNLVLNSVPQRACLWQTSPQSFWTGSIKQFFKPCLWFLTNSRDNFLQWPILRFLVIQQSCMTNNMVVTLSTMLVETFLCPSFHTFPCYLCFFSFWNEHHCYYNHLHHVFLVLTPLKSVDWDKDMMLEEKRWNVTDKHVGYREPAIMLYSRTHMEFNGFISNDEIKHTTEIKWYFILLSVRATYFLEQTKENR